MVFFQLFAIEGFYEDISYDSCSLGIEFCANVMCLTLECLQSRIRFGDGK